MPDLEVQLASVAPAHDDPSWRVLSIPVMNVTDHDLHVWATPRAIVYDAPSRTLSVRFAAGTGDIGEQPNIEVISVHPRLPAEAIAEPGATIRLTALIPATLQVVDLDAPSGGLGLAIETVPVGDIDQLNVEVAVADLSFDEFAGSEPTETVRRLRSEVNVVAASVSVTTFESERKSS